MPAGSELVLPHTWRPFGARIAIIVAGGGLALVCLMAWVAIGAETRAKFTAFELGTCFFLAALAGSVGFAIARSKVVASATELVVVNGYRRRVFEYAEVLAATLPNGAPWVTLDLADGTSISAMGIQGSDGARARQAVRELRAVLASR